VSGKIGNLPGEIARIYDILARLWSQRLGTSCLGRALSVPERVIIPAKPVKVGFGKPTAKGEKWLLFP